MTITEVLPNTVKSVMHCQTLLCICQISQVLSLMLSLIQCMIEDCHVCHDNALFPMYSICSSEGAKCWICCIWFIMKFDGIFSPNLFVFDCIGDYLIYSYSSILVFRVFSLYPKEYISLKHSYLLQTSHYRCTWGILNVFS